MHSASAAGSFHVVESPLPFQSATSNSTATHRSSSLQKNNHTNALNPNALPFQCSAFTAAPTESTSVSPVASSAATTPSSPSSVAVRTSMDSVFSKNASQPILWTSPASTAATSTTTTNSSAPMMMMAPVTSGVEGVDGGGRALHAPPPGAYTMPSPFLTSPHPVAAQAAYSLPPSGAPMMMSMQPMLHGTGAMTVEGGRPGREVFMMASPPSSMGPHAAAGMPPGSFLPMSHGQSMPPQRDGVAPSVFLYPSPAATSSPSAPPNAPASVFSPMGTPLPLGSPQMMWVGTGGGGGATQWTMGNQTRVDGNRYMPQTVASAPFLYPPPQQPQPQQPPPSSSASAPPPGMMMVPSNTPGMVMMMMMPTRDGVAPTTPFSPPPSTSSFSVVSSPYPSCSAPQATPLPFSDDSSAGVPLSAAYGGPPPPPPPPPSSQPPGYSSMEEMRMLHQLPYRAKMLPPPLSMKTHQILWEKNGNHDVAATGDRKEAGMGFPLDRREKEAREAEEGGRQGKPLPPPHHPTTGIHQDPLEPPLHLSREESKGEIDGGRSRSKTGIATTTTMAYPPPGEEKEKSHPSKSSREGHKEHQECSAEENSTISTDTTASLSPIRTTGEEGLERSVTEAVSDVPPQETTPSPPSSTLDGEGSSTKEKSERRRSADFALSPPPPTSAHRESIEGKWLRLRAYKEILERWFRHIQILQEKPEVIRMSISGGDPPSAVHPSLPPRNLNGCKSYEEILQRHLQSVHASRAMTHEAASDPITASTEACSEGSGEAPSDPTTPSALPLPVLSVEEEEEVLQWWSDECVKWWHDTQKKKTRRARKNKRPDDFSGVVGGSRNEGGGGGGVGSTTASAKGRDGEGGVDVAPLPILSDERSEAILAMQETSGKSAPPFFVATSLEKDGDFSSFGGFFSATGGIALVPPERYVGMGDEGVPRYTTSSMSRSSSEIEFEDDSYSHWELTEAMTSDLLREFDD